MTKTKKEKAEKTKNMKNNKKGLEQTRPFYFQKNCDSIFEFHILTNPLISCSHKVSLWHIPQTA